MGKYLRRIQCGVRGDSGRLVPRNRTLCMHWLSLAAARGFEQASAMLERLRETG